MRASLGWSSDESFRRADTPAPVARGNGCARSLDRGPGRRKPLGSCSHSRRRQCVRSRHGRSSTVVFPDGIHRRSGCLRHSFHVREERSCAPGPATGQVLVEHPHKEVHVPAEGGSPLRRRCGADGRRRGLLAPTARQPQGQSVAHPLRVQGVGEGQAHGRDRVERPGATTADDPHQRVRRHRQLEARQVARGNGRDRRVYG